MLRRFKASLTLWKIKNDNRTGLSLEIDFVKSLRWRPLKSATRFESDVHAKPVPLGLPLCSIREDCGACVQSLGSVADLEGRVLQPLRRSLRFRFRSSLIARRKR